MHPHSLNESILQGLMRTEGAVLRQLAPGNSNSSPWRVLLKDKRSDQFVQVGVVVLFVPRRVLSQGAVQRGCVGVPPLPLLTS